MVNVERRRKDIGKAGSAALPLVWEAIREREWTHAKLATELGEDPGKIAKLLYGDRKAGRRLAGKLLDRFGISLALWDEPLPENWEPWASDDAA